jgi:hypothetical protein
MFKLKSNWICSYCSKIFKDPIILPCADSICREHLSEKEVVKQNKIKCNECKQEVQVKDKKLKSNKTLTRLIDSKSYLNVEEISLKQKLEQTIRKFVQFYDEFIQTNTKLESDVFDHFQEMRFKVDEHRERLKGIIDDIALKMIEKIEKNEEIYLKNLKEKLQKNLSSFNGTKSLENELNEMEEMFRNPNLLIQSIKQMQRKHEESLNEIKSKLNEMNQLKADLKTMNRFQPNSSSLNQEESSLFGLIKLDGFWLNMKFSSQSLELQQSLELIKLCEFPPNVKWSLLYRGTRDGFGAKDFHSKCDGHSNTLTILKVKESPFVFGGFTAVEWDSSGEYKSDPNAFIFSLTNKDNKPLKINIDSHRHQYGILCNPEFGPIFGNGCDICIANDANKTLVSYSNLGYSYKNPQYAHGTTAAKTFLAGSYNFQLDEIGVYQKE